MKLKDPQVKNALKIAAVILPLIITLFGVRSSVSALTTKVDRLQEKVMGLKDVSKQVKEVSRDIEDVLEAIDRATRLRRDAGGNR